MAVILLGTIDVTALGAASAGAASAARRLLQSRDSTAIAPCSPSLEPCDRDHTVRVQPRNLQSAIDVRPAWPLRGARKIPTGVRLRGADLRWRLSGGSVAATTVVPGTPFTLPIVDGQDLVPGIARRRMRVEADRICRGMAPSGRGSQIRSGGSPPARRWRVRHWLKSHDDDAVALGAAGDRHEAGAQQRVDLPLGELTLGARLHVVLAVADEGINRQAADLALVARLHVPAACREGLANQQRQRQP